MGVALGPRGTDYFQIHFFSRRGREPAQSNLLVGSGFFARVVVVLVLCVEFDVFANGDIAASIEGGSAPFVCSA